MDQTQTCGATLRTASLVQQLRAAESDLHSVKGPSSLIIVTCTYERLPGASLFFPTTTHVWQQLERYGRRDGRFDAMTAAALGTSRTSIVADPRGNAAVDSQPWMIVSTTHSVTPFVISAEFLRKVMTEAPAHSVVEAGVARPGGEFWPAWDAAKLVRQLRPAEELAAGQRDAGVNGRSYGSRQPGFPGELLRPLPTTPIVSRVNVMADI